ncbi:hypothetical protein ONS95_003979 [Cadophora gregata]|uniref:uncharacterized protein n=1 Tax=Cadophora gregata TaxID=51156 RepID=UPI0026DB957D|nr:uncharacterized protein ONS95_003979 [Cadophora gregata]KAK0107279.1 hypothetical protein ONS95_003979 [Cadophora gregata]
MLKLPKLIYANKFCLSPLPPPGTFTNHTVLVTGGTSGLGLATAVHFLNLGAAKVTITGRTLAKGEEAKKSIETQVHVQDAGEVEVRVLDMSTFVGIKEFADKVKEEVKSVDYVLLNAGLLATSFRTGKEGYEESIAVNCLGTALLAILLLPWVKVAGRGNGHLGVVTSGLHRGIDISPGKWPQKDFFTYFSREENWPKGSPNMYSISKLLIQYCVNEIAKLAVDKDGTVQTVVNPMCPGMVKSSLGREHITSAIMGVAVDIFMAGAMKSTEGGARRLVVPALTTKEENGKYISDSQSHEEYLVAVQKNILGPEGQKMQKQVWEEALEILEQKVPEVREIVKSGAV